MSLAANAAAGLVLVQRARRWGLRGTAVRLGVVDPPPNDYAAIGRNRFTDVPAGRVALVGDSQAQNAPLLEMVSDWRQFGIGGATFRDVAAWWELAVERSQTLVLMAGTNDALIGRPVEDSVADVATLLDRARGRDVTVVSVPPLHAVDVRPLNNAVRGLCAERGCRWVDIAGTYWTDDGVHLNRAAYLRLAGSLPQLDG